MRTTLTITLAVATIAALTTSVYGNLITNGDMENNTLVNSSDTQTTLPAGWIQATGVSGTVAVIGEDRLLVSDDTTAPGHISWLHLQGINNEAGQDIGSVSSLLGRTLEISYDITRRNNEGDNWNHRVRLYAGDSGYAASSDTADPDADLMDAFLAEAVVTLSGDSSAGEVITNTLELTLPDSYTGSLDNVFLSFKNRAGGNAQLHFDDVSASANIIPEPTSVAIWSLIGLGLCGAACRRMWRRQ